MADIFDAQKLLSDKIRLAVIKGDKTFTSEKRGIAPLVELIESGEDLRGAVAADRIVGKAAALLYALMGISEVYAEVVSSKGVETLIKHDIPFTFGECAPFIRNRAGDGQCPMECTVEQIDDPAEAFEALKAKIAELRNKK